MLFGCSASLSHSVRYKLSIAVTYSDYESMGHAYMLDELCRLGIWDHGDTSVETQLRPKLHYFDLLWSCRTACCTTSPQRIEASGI